MIIKTRKQERGISDSVDKVGTKVEAVVSGKTDKLLLTEQEIADLELNAHKSIMAQLFANFGIYPWRKK